MERLNEDEVAARETTRLVAEAVLGGSGDLDQVGTWLLAVYGISGSLVVGNLEAVSRAIDPASLGTGLTLLMVGALFGLLQKFAALNVKILLAVDGALRLQAKELRVVAEREGRRSLAMGKVSLPRIRELVLDLTPWWARARIGQQLADRAGDSLALHRKAVRFYARQAAYGFLEAVVFILMVGYLGLAVQF